MGRTRRRLPWQDPYDHSLSPGWALTFIVGGIVAFVLLTYWINDMHMYGYGLFGR